MDDSRTVEVFIMILRSVLTGTPIDLPDDLKDYVVDILRLAKAQDVLQIICQGIKNNNGILPPGTEKEVFSEVYRYTQNDYVFKLVKKILSSTGIIYVPLKGSIIQNLYPEKWMRSSCDIDILVKEEELERAVNALVVEGFRTKNKKEYHDISLFFHGAHLELHFNICENIQRIDKALALVWDNVEQISEFEYQETAAFFAFHNVAHLMYHFLRGGCNIKQFIDLWLLKQNHTYEEKDIQPFLRMCKMEKFYKVICDAIDAWFGNKERTILIQQLEKQVLKGGITGNGISAETINFFLSGGKWRYLFESTFLPLREMKWYYPSLKEYPFLLPFYYSKRLYSKTLGREKNRSKTLLKTIINEKKSSDTLKLLSEMGLD